MSAYSIGIDFGTSKSAIAYTTRSSTDSLITRHVKLYGSEDFLPSCVYIDDSGKQREFLVGERAIRRFSETGDINRYFSQFKLDLDQEPIDKHYTNLNVDPVTLTAIVIRELLIEACQFPQSELYRNGWIKDATITIPAKWSESRMTQTLEAARAAGLENVRLAKEPTAALHFINWDKGLTSQPNQKYMIVDYGGGTCDVTICETFTLGQEAPIISENTLDHDVGGRDIDRALANLFLEWACDEWKVSPTELGEYRRHWEIQAEQEKMDYTWWFRRQNNGHLPIKIKIDGKGKYPSFERELLSEDFNQSVFPVVKNILVPIERALKGASLESKDISQVFLVGGSSLVPIVIDQVQEMFGSRAELANSPRSAVCYGSSLWQYYKSTKVQSGFQARYYSTLSLITRKRQSVWERIRLRANNGMPNETQQTILISKGLIQRENRQPKTLTLQVPEDGMRYVEIRIIENDEDDSDSERIYTEKLIFPEKTDIPQGTPIRITYFVNLDDRLEVHAELITKNGKNKVPLIIGKRPVNDERIRHIREIAMILAQDE